MRLISCEAENFGSYSVVNFEFSSQNLVLISGPTGAGKSTLQDIVPWGLFGITAKDGAADEIRPFGTQEITKVTVTIEIGSDILTIVRIRGAYAKQNDFFWRENDGEEKRGKDMVETQECLNKRLGFDHYNYIVSSYYNEHNPASLFFTSRASERRTLFESVVDLSFPLTLAESIQDNKKEVRASITLYENKISKTQGKIEALKASIKNMQASLVKWDVAQNKRIEDASNKNANFLAIKHDQIEALKLKKNSFEKEKLAYIETLTNSLYSLKQKREALGESVCKACGQNIKEISDLERQIDSFSRQIRDYSDKENPFSGQIILAQAEQNPYDAQLKYLKEQKNPHDAQITQTEKAILDEEKLLDSQVKELADLEKRFNSLTTLLGLVGDMRVNLVKEAIEHIETHTNAYLERYFDAKLRVAFEADEKDNLLVSIRNDGYECSYRQLSKGEKGLLKLCFSVAIMKASSAKSGVHYNTLFFDESLDGFDAQLKIKAYSLFESLLNQHESILVIDHHEGLSSLFSNKYSVENHGGYSTISRI